MKKIPIQKDYDHYSFEFCKYSKEYYEYLIELLEECKIEYAKYFAGLFIAKIMLLEWTSCGFYLCNKKKCEYNLLNYFRKYETKKKYNLLFMSYCDKYFIDCDNKYRKFKRYLVKRCEYKYCIYSYYEKNTLKYYPRYENQYYHYVINNMNKLDKILYILKKMRNIYNI